MGNGKISASLNDVPYHVASTCKLVAAGVGGSLTSIDAATANQDGGSLLFCAREAKKKKGNRLMCKIQRILRAGRVST